MSTLSEALDQLRGIQSAIPTFASSARRPQLPVLDDSLDGANSDDKEAIQGLAHFKDRVQSEIEFVVKFAGRVTNEPNSNAPNLVAVWNEIVAAPPPVLGIGRSFNSSSTSVKVDVVSDDGRQWTRVNTIKNSRLRVEFREQDSYVTDSEDEADEEDLVARAHASPLRNSVLDMANQLLTAAQENPMSGVAPTVVLRLTRLDPAAGDDPRIARTIEKLRDMPGLILELGEREFVSNPTAEVEEPLPQTNLIPTQNVNLDLSLLVALVSDITHATLPSTAAEAMERFKLTKRPHARRVPTRSNGTPVSDDDLPSATHLNALANQVIQEMHASIIVQMAERSTPNTRFWTTAHARDRCLRIVERIGGPDERARARAWLSDDDPAAFWRNSRHEHLASQLPLVPLVIFPNSEEGSLAAPTVVSQEHSSSDFYAQIARTCDLIFTRSNIPAPEIKATETAQKTGVGRLTVHTVQSLAAGARSQMTTLTANRASVRAFLREMRGAGHVPSAVRVDVEAADACIWIVDPRSLSEGMRADRVGATNDDALAKDEEGECEEINGQVEI